MLPLSEDIALGVEISETLFVSHIKNLKPSTEQAAGDELRDPSFAKPNMALLKGREYFYLRGEL
jgi:hypothetical protein